MSNCVTTRPFVSKDARPKPAQAAAPHDPQSPFSPAADHGTLPQRQGQSRHAAPARAKAPTGAAEGSPGWGKGFSHGSVDGNRATLRRGQHDAHRRARAPSWPQPASWWPKATASWPQGGLEKQTSPGLGPRPRCGAPTRRTATERVPPAPRARPRRVPPAAQVKGRTCCAHPCFGKGAKVRLRILSCGPRSHRPGRLPPRRGRVGD